MVIKKPVVLFGKEESLKNIPFHNNAKAPLTRFILANDTMAKGIGLHVALHVLSGNFPKRIPKYCSLHSHNCPELGIFLSESGKLVYEIILGKEKTVFEITPEKPLFVLVPSKTEHSFRVKSGKGAYICVLFEGNYVKSLIPKEKF